MNTDPRSNVSMYRQSIPTTSHRSAAAVECAFEGLVKELARRYPESLYLCDFPQSIKIPVKEWALNCLRHGVPDMEMQQLLAGFADQIHRLCLPDNASGIETGTGE